MKHITLTLALIAGSAVANERTVHVMNGVDYAIPSHSPVTFASLGDFTTANFSGRFKLRGTYYLQYSEPSTGDIETDGVELYFVPEKQYRLKLPYLKGRSHVYEMWFSNKDAFIRAVVPANVIETARKAKSASVHGQASIVVENYQASVECDYPSYSVTFVSLQGAENAEVAQVDLTQYGC